MPARTMRYVPVEHLERQPHVMVDGAPRPGTVCTLSHWPGTPTAPALWDDTSAGIVLAGLAQPGALPPGVTVASVDHYDADGVIALALLCTAGLAERHGPLLVEAAAVGDFDVVRSRPAALVAFALGRVGDSQRALDLMPGLAEDPDRHRSLWEDEARAYDAAVSAVEDGRVTIDEEHVHDVAVVRVHRAAALGDGDGDGTAWKGAPVHRAALHSRTSCLRILTVAGPHIELRYRYESWVRLVSRRPRPRVDLGPLAAALTRAEDGAARWVFDGAGAITPALRTDGGAPSALDPDVVVERVLQELERLDAGPAAWDPYAGGRGGG